MNLLKRGGGSPPHRPSHSPSRSRSSSPVRALYPAPQMGGENSAFKALSQPVDLKSLSHPGRFDPVALKALSHQPFENSAFKPHAGLDGSAFKGLVPHSAAAALLAAQSLQLSRGYQSNSDSDEEINVNDESDDERDRNKCRAHSRSLTPSPQRQLPSNDLPLQLTKHDR